MIPISSCPIDTAADPALWCMRGSCSLKDCIACELRASITDVLSGKFRFQVCSLRITVNIVSEPLGQAVTTALPATDYMCTMDSNACAWTFEAVVRWPRFEPPRRPDGTQGIWGYIACDGDLLFGSLVDQNYLVKSWSDRWDTGGQFTESLLLFALDARTGKVKWTFEPQHSIRHNTIAIGHGRVYLVDRAPAPFDDVRLPESDARALAQRRAQAEGSGEDEVYQSLISHRPGRLLALDVQTGQPLWRADKETFATLLVYSNQHDVLLAAYQAVHQATRDSERGDRLAAFRADRRQATLEYCRDL